MILKFNKTVLVVALAIYTVIEIASLLFGFEILLTSSYYIAGLILSTVILGGLIEGMLPLKGDCGASGIYKPYIRGVLYFIPPELAFEGRLYNWELIFSFICYMLLMLSIVWRLIIRKNSSNKVDKCHP